MEFSINAYYTGDNTGKFIKEFSNENEAISFSKQIINKNPACYRFIAIYKTIQVTKSTTKTDIYKIIYPDK